MLRPIQNPRLGPSGQAHPGWLLSRLALLLLLTGAGACRTGPTFAPIDTSAQGWALRQGQALWRSSGQAPELAGDIVIASHPDGRALVQFSKTPLPLVTARLAPERWQVQYGLRKRTRSGWGEPPAQDLWLQVVPALRGVPLTYPLTTERLPGSRWQLQNVETGEILRIDLEP